MSQPDLVVFDMIGTTIQSGDAVPEAFKASLSEAGVHISDDDIASMRGKSKRTSIEELLAGQGNVDAVLETFKTHLVEHYRSAGTAEIPGAFNTFNWCRANDVNVALTTGLDSDVALVLIDTLGWGDTVQTVVCSDDVKNGRPAPDLILMAMRRLGHIDVARVATVGDTVSDLEAGANAGTAWNIGVLSGAHSREQLQAAPHTAIIESVEELPFAF